MRIKKRTAGKRFFFYPFPKTGGFVSLSEGLF